MKMWIGTEVEGIHKGLKTLFIASKFLSSLKIINAIEDYDVEQIYFGAGCCTAINYIALKECIKKYNNKLIITAEVDNKFLELQDISVLKQINLIVTINSKNFILFNKLNKNNIQIKIQTLPEKLITFNLKDGIETDCSNLDGKKYKDDVIIDE